MQVVNDRSNRDLRRACDLTGAYQRGGFTLVELLVVIAIIGVLVALLLPAVQAAREAARRSQCQNNVKQLMLGLHMHHDAKGAFPAAQEVYVAGNENDPANTNHSWVPHILPFIEQQGLYATYDFTKRWNQTPNSAITRIQTSAVDITMLLCPTISERPDKATSDYAAINGPDGASYNTWPGRGPTLTVGSYRPDLNGDYVAGIFPAVGFYSDGGLKPLGTQRIRIKDITDGTTNSIALGEDAGRTDIHKFWACGDNSFAHHHVINDPEDRNNELFSEHPGGLHIGMGDASVKFLNENTSDLVVDFLATRAGEELLPSDF